MDEAKRDLIRAWLTKAKNDLGTARKLATGPDSYPDTAVYHCQQAAEKAIKAYLVFYDHPFPKSHDFRLLVQEAKHFDPAISALEDSADTLTPLATAYRYPGELLEPDSSEVVEGLELSSDSFDFILARIPPDAHPR